MANAKSLERPYRYLDHAELERIASDVYHATIPEIRVMARSKSLPVIQVWIARGFLDDYRRGRLDFTEALMARVEGMRPKGATE